MSLAPRVVLVHRRTEFAELIARHGTRGQAAFFLSTRERSIDEVEARAQAQRAAMAVVTAAIPLDWRRGEVERADLCRFIFSPDDVIIVVGQDGLVANVAKYLDGQPVIGVNPDPARNPGVLVPHAPAAITDVLGCVGAGRIAERLEGRTMVEADVDDGQVLSALNEIFIGHPSHQTARYVLGSGDAVGERQASSGVIVATGTGATGWCRSAWLERHSGMSLPSPVDQRLAWFVREAWPSPATGTSLTEGAVAAGAVLKLAVESDQLVAFGDGIETDFLSLTWGQTVTVRIAPRRLQLVV